MILAPMLQLGCFRACSGPIFSISSAFLPKNGPPDAVSSSRSISPSLLPCRHWKMALCSESTGMMATPFSAAKRFTSSPAHTSDSLLANASVLPASMAATVGFRPEMPTAALSTRSLSASAATRQTPSSPQQISVSVKPFSFSASARPTCSSNSAATRGLTCKICFSKASAFRPAANPAT